MTTNDQKVAIEIEKCYAWELEENGNIQEQKWYQDALATNPWIEENGFRPDTVNYRDLDAYYTDPTSKDKYPIEDYFEKHKDV